MMFVGKRVFRKTKQDKRHVLVEMRRHLLYMPYRCSSSEIDQNDAEISFCAFAYYSRLQYVELHCWTYQSCRVSWLTSVGVVTNEAEKKTALTPDSFDTFPV